MRTPFLPYVTSSLTTSAWGILQVPLSALRDLFQSCISQPISLGNFSPPDPNTTALILAFYPTRDCSASFPCPFPCAVPGPLPLLRRAGQCSRQSSPSCASHITGHSPTSQSLHHLLSHFKNAQSKIWESLRVEKELSFHDHCAMSYSTSLWSPLLEKGVAEKVTTRDYGSVQNSHRVDNILRELGFSPASQLNWNQPEIRCYQEKWPKKKAL